MSRSVPLGDTIADLGTSLGLRCRRDGDAELMGAEVLDRGVLPGLAADLELVELLSARASRNGDSGGGGLGPTAAFGPAVERRRAREGEAGERAGSAGGLMLFGPPAGTAAAAGGTKFSSLSLGGGAGGMEQGGVGVLGSQRLSG